MEFEHVGQHCAQADCNQKDFLPFTCDTCKKPYCLSHRSYLAHSCIGAAKKDMTSMDCPICNKSVKFDKSQDPNEVWNQHYSRGCSRVANPDATKAPKKCGKAGCNTTLGPSNTFICPKCNKSVCLSHRMTDDHNCSGAAIRDNRGFFLGLFDSSTGGNSKSNKNSSSGSGKATATRQPTASNSSSGGSKPKPKPTSREVIDLTDSSNTLKGTVTKRMKPAEGTAAVSSGSGGELCPLCNMQFADAVQLVAHFDAAHPEGNTAGQESENNSMCSIH